MPHSLSSLFYTFYCTGANTDILLSANPLHVGLAITNRDLADTCYLSFSPQITAGSSLSIRLRPNETLTLLKSEGDDTTKQIYILGTAGIVVEIIESMGED